MREFNEASFIMFSKGLAEEVYIQVKEYYKLKLLNGRDSLDYVANPKVDPKAEHKVDKFVKEIVLDFIRGKHPFLHRIANIYMEDSIVPNKEGSCCSLFIDPIDGSRSADHNIGDPCFMIALSNKTDTIKFKDLSACYIKLLKSGDVYFTYNEGAYYIPGGHDYELVDDGVLVDQKYYIDPIRVKNNCTSLADSTVIIRDGYGMRKIVDNKINYSILNQVKHNFLYDITGTELCYLARGRDIVHIIVEARKHMQNGKLIGSDGFNLIPYPLIKAAGAVVLDLCGQEIEDIEFDPYSVYDFIACSNRTLACEFIESALKKNA